jgi:hypothetical protein
MWIAVSLAAIFVLAMVFDAYQRRRKRARKGSAQARISSHKSPGFFRRMRHTYESFRKENSRRRRHIQRNHEREEALRGRK